MVRSPLDRQLDLLLSLQREITRCDSFELLWPALCDSMRRLLDCDGAVLYSLAGSQPLQLASSGSAVLAAAEFGATLPRMILPVTEQAVQLIEDPPLQQALVNALGLALEPQQQCTFLLHVPAEAPALLVCHRREGPLLDTLRRMESLILLEAGMLVWSRCLRQPHGTTLPSAGGATPVSDVERLHALIDATNDGMLLLDAQGRTILVNRRAKYFFDLSERELIGLEYLHLRTLFDLIFEESTQFTSWLSDLLVSDNERAVREFQVRHPVPRLLQCFCGPVNNRDGQLLGRLLVFRDITREREVERMKNEFVSVVSHELRTPLTSIRGALQLVLGRSEPGELKPRASELLSISLTNTDRLIRLINDILDIAKIEQGRVQLRREAIAAAELCRIAVNGVAALAAARNVTLDLQLDSQLPPVSADRDRAVQILTNLLSNAIKFSLPGQTVLVSIAAEPNAVRFTVRDWGRGIALENQQRLFQKFSQVDSVMTRDVGGTGLGLAICKALVEEHGGRIWLESQPGQGATFSFTLPLARDTGNDAWLVLLVDAGKSSRDVFRAGLTEAGYLALETSSGAEAVRLARQHRPALIVLDEALPDLDVFDVVRLLRSDPLTSTLPVLVLASGNRPSQLQVTSTSGIEYLEKPSALNTFVQAIRRIVGKQG